ncbi:MAG: hypothetical protein PVH61_18215 [Candidatus Aminicenantes bacterium]|jgi:hypothetical protein
MKKMSVFLLAFVLVISFSSLLEAKKKTYLVNMILDKVTREPAPEKEIKVVAGKSFSDELIQIKWTPTPEALKFELFNNSGDAISIIREESSFIDKDKRRHRVLHSGFKPKSINMTMPPRDIPAKQKIKDMVYPGDYFFQKQKTEVARGLDGSRSYSGTVLEWKKKPIFEKKVRLKEPEDFDFAGYKANLEKALFDVILSLKAGEKKYKYTFYFKPEVTEK